jgi:hypothetical protein
MNKQTLDGHTSYASIVGVEISKLTDKKEKLSSYFYCAKHLHV